MTFHAAALIRDTAGERLVTAEIKAPDREQAEVFAMGRWSRRGAVLALVSYPAGAK